MAKLVLKARHRVMCGDSTSAEDVAKLMASAIATFVFTSPPYAQQRDYGAAKEKVSDWDALMQGVFAAAPVSDDAQLLVNLGLVHRDGEWMPYWQSWVEWMREQGWRRFGWYVWDQGPGMPGDRNGRLAPCFEFLFHFNKSARPVNKSVQKKPEFAKVRTNVRTMRRKDGTLQRFSNDVTSAQPNKIHDAVFHVSRHYGSVQGGKHPAVFPVALVEEVFAAFTDPDELVFEPFCGSGTQVIAAEKMGRRCFGMELDPAYVDVACRRWLHFTGAEPVHEATGKTFSEMTDGQAQA